MSARARRETASLILTVLADGNQHGYGIIAGVRRLTGGQVRLRPGTLYTALDQLRTDGMISVARQDVAGNRPRRYYQLTPAAGRAAPPPELRVGDADREATAATLREHFAEGRMTLDELIARLDTTFTATTRGELARATLDMPDLDIL
jgi:DNA-binding HxlR family transcriptional regulator